ncbi:restriction endonuclease subunit S [Streptococcus suis]|uniref:restriction endonuclease subunit S n=1 Tax=Streptococcus suis TaxID=1307 RepID=UPI0011565094|nr:restriction endonuclease subunit S [Streptococcus suis]QZT28559.1 restriction endonuclease subunit S [Streptococcus suis]
MTKKLPHYRFQGYTDAWELRKAMEIFKIVSDKGYADLPILSASQELGMIRRDEIGIDIKYDKEAVANYKRVLPGQFVIHLRSFQGGFAWSEIEGLTSPAYTILDFKEENSSKFWRHVLTSPNFIKKLETVTYGIRDGRSISYSDFSTLNFVIPSLPEQEAIGTFFSTLDRHITLQQRKLDTLKEQKKTYLKLLFPAKGQTKPALRFQGFEDDWKEVKLGEVLVEYNKKSEIENQFELLSSTNSGIEPRSGRVSGESNIGYKIIKRGMVVLSPQNLWLGNINYNAKFEIGIVSPSYKVFNINGPNELYLATVLRLPKMFFEYAQASVQGASIVRRNLDLDLFGSILVQLPSLPEQEAIGTFFQTLDQEIAQVEDKLASLKEMKKTLLRKLFV